jgi:hypothetical protein
MDTGDEVIQMEIDSEVEAVQPLLERFGLPANPNDADEIRALLRKEIHNAYEEGISCWMRLLCVQLFSIGDPADAILIWQAKSCNFDTMMGLQVAFLCGAGISRTKDYLRAMGTDDAVAALEYIEDCEQKHNFDGFNPQECVDDNRRYYELD